MPLETTQGLQKKLAINIETILVWDSLAEIGENKNDHDIIYHRVRVRITLVK